jgi:hypothetical protein
MVTTYKPKYFAKVLTLAGTSFALEDAGIEFVQGAYVPGQKNMGSCKITLKNTQDPRWKSLQPLYRSLDYEQRLEIYDNDALVGDPKFTGVITGLPADLGTQAVQGVGILRRLDSRHLRRYETLTGTATSVATNLLKTWGWLLKEDWSTGTFAQWSTHDGWIITGGYSQADSIASSTLETIGITSPDGWSTFEGMCDFQLGQTATLVFDFPYRSVHDYVTQITSGTPSMSEAGIYCHSYHSGADFNANYGLVAGTDYHLDFRIVLSGGSRTVSVDINGVNIIEFTEANSVTYPASSTFAIQGSGGGVGGTFHKVKNIVVLSKTSPISAGTIEISSTQLDQQFNGGSNLNALNWVCEYMNWSYRVQPKAGAGNDIVDIGLAPGTDYSNSIRLEEGVNISDLRRDRVGYNLATQLNVYGQSRDDALSNFVCTQLSQWDTYGIVEDDYQDARVIDTDTAELLGNNRLAITAYGVWSYNGTVADGSLLRSVQAGDFVWLKSDTLDVDKKVRLVQLTRTKGTPEVKFVADYLPGTDLDGQRRLMQLLEENRRAFTNRMNSQSAHWVFASGSSQDWYVYIRGQVNASYLDITQPSPYVSIQVYLDGHLVASAVGNMHIKDTTYLITSGTHKITFVTGGAVTFDAALQPLIYS